MPRYRVFGRRLYSELEIPELPFDTDGPDDWTLRVLPPIAGPPEECRLLGRDEVDAGITVRLHASPSGLWLHFDDTGCFEIAHDGTTIRWYAPSPDVAPLARLDVLGRVLAAALHAQGMLCLHGSGVCIGNQAIGFLAPKFHGKSTTALALVRAGARLITDDTLVVQPGTPAMAHPGVHVARLWSDSVSRLVEGGAGDGERRAKHSVTDLPEDRLLQRPTPVAALYLLAPVTPAPERAAVHRSQLDPMRAALALVGHGKLTALFGGPETATTLERAVEVARSVPVYQLAIVRDFAELDHVVSQIGAWHGGLPAAGRAEA
jgi:hypothetical protein